MRRRKPTTLPIGSVSTATLRSSDLIDAFLFAADQIRLSKSDRARCQEISKAREADEDSEYWISGAAEEDVNALQDILDQHVPPYCYFGAHEGDGSDFGVWPSMESLDDAKHEGEIWLDQGNGAAPPITAWRYRLVVSDHGNMTLYHRNGREVWGIV